MAQRNALVGVDLAIDRTDVAWWQVFEHTGFELDAARRRNPMNSIAPRTAHEEGIAAASKLVFGLQPSEPAWVAERGASFERARVHVECPTCGTAT